jgi:hypothetical protein
MASQSAFGGRDVRTVSLLYFAAILVNLPCRFCFCSLVVDLVPVVLQLLSQLRLKKAGTKMSLFTTECQLLPCLSIQFHYQFSST